ncbi:hypothetical protein JW848_05020 [Candidatus Bipolaricaulota bacterium]|nr:hypothetical protein [Candidatus Bipolaricaulota bacterium]
MARILFAIGVLSMFSVGGVASSSSAEAWGQAGGVCLASWAPCVALHQAYGEYLFQGIRPDVPDEVATASQQTRGAVERLLLLVADDPSPPADPIVAATALLHRLDEVEQHYREIFQQLDDLVDPDPEALLSMLEDASDAGFFVMILDVKESLDVLVESLLAEIGDADDRTRFSAAFIAEGLLTAPGSVRFDPQWIEALVYLGEASTAVLPVEAVDAIGRLIEVAEGPDELTAEDWRHIRSEAARLKEALHGAFVTPESPTLASEQSPNEISSSGDHDQRGAVASTKRWTLAVVIGLGLMIALGIVAADALR